MGRPAARRRSASPSLWRRRTALASPVSPRSTPPWITRPMATGIGGSAWKVQMEVEELRRAHREAGAALAALRAAVAEAGIACEAREREGDPAETIEAEAT